MEIPGLPNNKTQIRLESVFAVCPMVAVRIMIRLDTFESLILLLLFETILLCCFRTGLIFVLQVFNEFQVILSALVPWQAFYRQLNDSYCTFIPQ